MSALLPFLDSSAVTDVTPSQSSFCYAGQDRVTFRLHPKGALQLIFHRGAKVRADNADFTFDDPSGLLTWLAADRAIITLHDLAAVSAQQSTIVDVVNKWVEV